MGFKNRIIKIPKLNLYSTGYFAPNDKTIYVAASDDIFQWTELNWYFVEKEPWYPLLFRTVGIWWWSIHCSTKRGGRWIIMILSFTEKIFYNLIFYTYLCRERLRKGKVKRKTRIKDQNDFEFFKSTLLLSRNTTLHRVTRRNTRID